MVRRSVIDWQRHYYKYRMVEERPIEKQKFRGDVCRCNHCGSVYVWETGSCIRHLLHVCSICGVALEILLRYRIRDAQSEPRSGRNC